MSRKPACRLLRISGVAILARHYGIPFYVCAPSSIFI